MDIVPPTETAAVLYCAGFLILKAAVLIAVFWRERSSPAADATDAEMRCYGGF